MHLLDNPIRPYAWGSTTTIPELLGVEPTGEPQAEMWMGAHPASPSYVVVDGERRSLIELIEADPEHELGKDVADVFGARLPFLMKLLAADAPLSLQAHPDPDQAREGFARENRLGIPLDAPHRNYKDPYAKPEMICALTPLEALIGFRSLDQVAADAETLGLAADLAPVLGTDVRTAFASLLELPESDRQALVARVIAACADSDLPVAGLVRRLGERYPGDAGVAAALLLNHVVLRPGQAVFLPSGNLHAYLEGFGVELLANSDNVLRGGLTPKHIDVAELLRILDFSPGPVEVLEPETRPSGEAVFRTPVPEFCLSRVDIAEGSGAPGGIVELEPRGAQILVCTEGRIEVSSADDTVVLTPGRSAYASAADGVVGLSGAGTVFRATADPDL